MLYTRQDQPAVHPGSSRLYLTGLEMTLCLIRLAECGRILLSVVGSDTEVFCLWRPKLDRLPA